jgi:regulator of protease activity HflC (stomatin/prohibitin superfamily)
MVDYSDEFDRTVTHCRRNKCFYGGWSTIILSVLTIVLLAISIKKIDPQQIGYTENQITMSIKGPFDQGLHPFLPGDSLVVFDRIFQQLLLEVDCMTLDKMKLTISVSLQYQYNQEKIIPVIWYQFGDEDHYVDFLRKNITTSLITSCAKYTAIQYYDLRGQVEKTMEVDLIYNLNGNSSMFGSDIKALQLKNIEFPPELNAIIVRRQLIDQEQNTQINNRTTQLILANTTLLSAQQQAISIQIYANNTAKITMQQAETNANVIRYQWSQLVDALLYSKNASSWNNTQAIMNANLNTLPKFPSWIINAQAFMTL